LCLLKFSRSFASPTRSTCRASHFFFLCGCWPHSISWSLIPMYIHCFSGSNNRRMMGSVRTFRKRRPGTQTATTTTGTSASASASMSTTSLSTAGPGGGDSSVDLSGSAGVVGIDADADEKQVDEWMMELLDAAVGGICGPLKVSFLPFLINLPSISFLSASYSHPPAMYLLADPSTARPDSPRPSAPKSLLWCRTRSRTSCSSTSSS
jgi:hypothetical protein